LLDNALVIKAIDFKTLELINEFKGFEKEIFSKASALIENSNY